MTEKISDSDFQFVRTFIKNKAAIQIEEGKAYLVEARLAALIKKININSIAELIAIVRKDATGACAQGLIGAMTTNETSFFRDGHPFEALRKEIIPKLIQDRSKEKTLRIWCGAASTGQEPYTIALCLKEYFPAVFADWQISIMATDLSEEVLTKARQGLYSQLEVNRGLPASFLVKYFKKNGMNWQINDDIRNAIVFKKMNLIENWPIMSKYDIVFLRNVLIYFELEEKRKIIQKIHHNLHSDGYLFLGATETTFNLNVPFTRQQLAGSFYYAPNSGKGE